VLSDSGSVERDAHLHEHGDAHEHA
jgi:hypothetical protein